MRILMMVLGMVFGVTVSGIAQVEYPGTPYRIDSSKNSPVPFTTVQDVAKHELFLSAKGSSPNETELLGYTVSPTMQEVKWHKTRLSSGRILQSAYLRVPDAMSSILYLDDVSLKKNAELYVYDFNTDFYRGKFDYRSINEGKLSIAEIPSDSIVVQLVIDDDDDISTFHISSIGIIVEDGTSDNFDDFDGNSGNCNVNVNCDEGEDWQCQKRGVARYLYRKNVRVVQPGEPEVSCEMIGACSGSLVNNTAQDGEPFFLTADHCLCNDQRLIFNSSNEVISDVCLNEWEAINNATLSTHIFYFNYERDVSFDNILGCIVNPFSSPDLSQTVVGASLVANNSDSDFALFRLNSNPLDAGYDVYFNGWNRTLLSASDGVGIHHPGGDVKKISVYTAQNLDLFTRLNSLIQDNYYEVASWSSGVTEGGSSGSPLFDAEKLIIGQLFGGTSINCNQDAIMRDFSVYGKIGVSWNSSSSFSRLSDWLDPLSIDPDFLAGTSDPSCAQGSGGECGSIISVDGFEQECLVNGRYRFRFTINAPFSRYKFSYEGTEIEFDVNESNQSILIDDLIFMPDELTVNFGVSHIENNCGLSFSHTFQEQCPNTCDIELVNSNTFCTSGQNDEFFVALKIDDKRAIGVEMILRDQFDPPITSIFINDDETVVVGPYPSETEVTFRVISSTTGCSETIGPFTQVCPDPCTIVSNCLAANTPACTGSQTFSFIPSFDGVLGVEYSIIATDQQGQELYRVDNAVPDATSEENRLFDLPTNIPLTITVRETNSLTCPVDVETISFFPPFTPLPSNALCSSDQFSVSYIIPPDALLPTYQISDGINPPQTYNRGESFYEIYPSGTEVTLTMSDPANPNCATISEVVTLDCGNPPVDDCEGAEIVSIGQADCVAGTVSVTISGNPGTTYLVQEILNGNDNNAAAVSVLGGNTTDVPFNADGSNLISFSLRYTGQPATEECDREVGAPVVCGPTGPGGGTPDECNTAVDPTTYSLYWPYPENSEFVGTNCGRGLSAPFNCGAAGSCGTNGYAMTVGDGCGAHWGNDFYAQDWSQSGSAAVCNDEFYAPMDGTVLYIYDQCAGSCGSAPNCTGRAYGNEVIILSSDGNYALRVGHLNTVSVAQNDPVFAGQLIGTIGNTGNSFGAHIHAALYQDVNDPSGGSTFVQRLRNGELFGVSNGSAATTNAQDFEFDCTNSIEVLSAASPGECVDPGSAFAIEFRERGTLQEVFVEFCPTDGGTCQTAAGGAPFVLNNLQATDTWTLNTTAPSAPGDYTIKIYDQNNTAVQASSAFPVQVTTDCGTVSMDCLPPTSVTPQSNASGTAVSISWPGVPGAVTYRVEAKTTDSDDWFLVSTTVGTTAGFTAQSCIGYDVRVASNCADGSRTAYTVSGIITAGCGTPTGSGGGSTGNSGGELVSDCPGDNEDDEDPVFINCPPDQIYVFGIDNADECEAYVNWSVPVAVDNCNVTVTYDGDIAPGTLQPVGSYTVSYVAEDNNDNTEVCSFTVRVEDGQALQFTNCPEPTDVLLFGNNTDLCSVTANFSIPVATDNCQVTVEHIDGPQPGDELAPGFYQSVYRATNNGTGDAFEEATCTINIQVQETQNPVLNCPQDVFVESDPGVCEAAVENIQLEFAFDNCPFTVTWTSSPANVTGTGTSTSDSASGAIFPVGVTTVTYTITEDDDFGNGNAVASCDLIVTVTDTEAPEITCPESVVIGTDDDGAGNYDCATDYAWTHPTPTDNCAVTVYELTYTNPDGSVEGPSDWGADAGAMVGRNFALGVTTILYHVEDAEGNVTECSWTVEVIDDEDPMIFCEENLATNEIVIEEMLDIYPRDTVAAVINVPVSATISDVNITALAGGMPDVGDLVVTLTSPAGTVITLFDGLCAGTADFDLALDDDALISVLGANCDPLGSGETLRPADALAAFNGENSQGDWVLTFSSVLEGECGGLEAWNLQIIGNDNTQPPVNRLQVIADANTCEYFLTGTDFDPRFIDNCEGAFITHDYLSGPFDTTLMGSTFPIGATEILWTVTDAAGNTATCPMIIEVLDNEAPTFTNCVRPDIIANPTPGVCDAFVNFSLPLAVDNCGTATVNQTDPTGLTSGMRFPVGTTILQYEAVDPAGNRTACEFRVIVNDNQGVMVPVGDGCPDDVETTADDGDCVAVVNGLAPNFGDNCGTNLSYVYKIIDENGIEIASGFTDASGQAFPLGLNAVTYRAQDQPVFLITEVTHEIQEVLGGNDVIPPYIGFRGLPDGDFLEMTNFGPARLNIGGLDIERITANGIDYFRVPPLEILEPGETFVLQFGNDDVSTEDHYYVVNCATDLTSSDGAAYVISHSGRVLDVVAINGFDPLGQGSAAVVTAEDWSGSVFDGLAGIRRASVYDDNTADDFVPATVCDEITIGTYNPDFAPVPVNGSLTSDQARVPNKMECSFTVAVTDEELPECGSYQPYDEYVFGTPTTIEPGDCFEATLSVAEAYELADVNIALVGMAGSFGNLRITLISPEGTEVILADNECGATGGFDLLLDSDSITRPFIQDACLAINQTSHLRPRQDLNAFHTRPSAGTWTLQIAHDATEDFEPVVLESWTLALSELIPYAQADTTIENDFRECGADFTWLHTGIWDNCPGGTVSVTYFFKDTIQDAYAIPRNRFGRDTTRFFDVGVTTVEYTLTDVNGNVSTCSFDLTVLDTEPPVLVCPSDTTLFLAGGECDIVYIPIDWSVTDNCVIRDTLTAPNWNLPLPIGINPVDLTVRDTSGNATTCTYVVTVVEYTPNPPQMACVGDLNVSLDNDCEVEIIPAMLLAGDEYRCFDDYLVTLLQERDDEPGVFDTLPQPVVGEGQIQDTLIYQVYDPENDILCWGYLRVGFFKEPEFICPADTFIKCNGDFDPALNGEPILLSCALAGATVSYADTLQQFEACDDPRAILRRTWLVADAYGNSASCVQTITMEAFDLDDVVFPADLDGDAAPALSCFAVANDPTLTDPANTGFPTVLQGSNVFQTNFCSASYLYTDEVYDICAGSFEIVRTWKVRSTCGPVVPGVNPIVGTQIIRVLDQENPALVCPEPDTISTGGFGCTGEYAVPVPVVEESCSSWTYEVTVSGGTLAFINDRYYLVNLEEGTTTIRYYVEDECGRFSECIYPVFVTDLQGTNAVCEDQINVSLDGNGTAVITPDDVDAGSDDFCSAVSLRVRREFANDPDNCSAVTPFFGTWGDSVVVNCCEVNETVKVELEVTDEDGNASVCWTNVLVEDKALPVCLPPPPVAVTCDNLIGNLPDDLIQAVSDDPEGTFSLLDVTFGPAGAGDNCGGAVITQTVTDNREACGVGEIIRRFTVTDAQGQTNMGGCTQTITVSEVNDYVIGFPADARSTICELPAYDTLTTTSAGCDLLIRNVSVDTFAAQGEECYLLRINHEVINWCEYSTEASAYVVPRPVEFFNDLSERVYLHVIPGPTNDRADDLALVSSAPNILPGNLTSFLDRQDEGTAGYPGGLAGTQDGASTLNGYGTDPARGHFIYHQFVAVLDEVAPVIVADAIPECLSGQNDDCSATLEYTFTAYDNCGRIDPVVELDLNFVAGEGFTANALFSAAEIVANGDSTYTITRPGVAPGTHALRIRTNDGCGNVNARIIEFCVEGDVAPTPICIQTLTVTVMPDGQGGGMAALWATDAIASDVFDCYGNLVTDYSIYLETDAAVAGFSPMVGDTGIIFDCSMTSDNVPARVYAIGQDGQADFCQISVDVQLFADEMCEQDAARATLAGTIVTEQNDGVENVIVNLDNGAITAEYTTEDDGQFTFADQLYGPDYTITPEHRTDYLNGVRTSDIIGITQHILGLQLLDSPYKILAADVDGNTEVNVGDIINIRRLILGLSEQFPNDMPSWAFVSADYAFPDAGNPWAEAFPAVANYNDLASNVLNADFIAVKLGDVNGSARPSQSAIAPPNESRGALRLRLPEWRLPAGQDYNLPVMATNLGEFTGFQGTLLLDATAVSLTGVEPGLIGEEGLVLSRSENGVRISWNRPEGLVVDDRDVLFSVRLRAREDVFTSAGLDFGSRFVAAEAYRLNGAEATVDLQFDGVGADPAYRLLPSLPNPFRVYTTVRFELPEPMAAVNIQFRDARGKVVANYTTVGYRGYNDYRIMAKDLGVAGVFTYTVSAGEWREVGKVVLTK